MDRTKKEKILRITLLILVFLSLVFSSKAQIKLSFQSEVGHTNISEGVYLKTSIGGSYVINGFEIETALESDLISEEQKLISGWNMSVQKEFELAEREVSVKPFIIYTPFSELLNETNWGVLLGTDFNKFSLNLGTGFRTMAYSRDVINEGNRFLYENFILLYKLKYRFLCDKSKWKVQVSVTNIDHFLVQQATNPILSFEGGYKLNDALELFTEFRYKTAGMMNMHVNYFGTLWRTGIVWKL